MRKLGDDRHPIRALGQGMPWGSGACQATSSEQSWGAEKLGEEGAGSAGTAWSLPGERGAWWGCRHPEVLGAGLVYTSQAQGEQD